MDTKSGTNRVDQAEETWARSGSFWHIWRTSLRMTLPVTLLSQGISKSALPFSHSKSRGVRTHLTGTRGTNFMPPRKCLYSLVWEDRNASNSLMSSGPAFWHSGTSSMYARGISVILVRFSTPTTAASRTLGCVLRIPSNSAGGTLVTRPLGQHSFYRTEG